MRNILVVNDDGINAPGISELARHAVKFGRVTVAAPEFQCSAMSQRIIIDRPLIMKERDPRTDPAFNIEGIDRVYSLDGTPADCVRCSIGYIMKEKPDIVFSGINDGYNTGVDILYSGTVGAAMQGIAMGVPAIAFSIGRGAKDFSVIDRYLEELTGDLLERDIAEDEIWNVNFPNCHLSEVKGVLYGRTPDTGEFTADVAYRMNDRPDGSRDIMSYGVRIGEGAEGSDKAALLENYISVGKLKNMVL